MLGSAASQVQLLGIDANPKATAIDDVLSYSQLHGMLYQWRYLTGSLPQLESVWKDYSVGVDVSQNQVDHEPAIFVINQQGRLEKLYLTQLAYSAVPQLGQLLATEVSRLLPSHPAVHSHLSYAQVAAISPAYPTTLPGAGGGYVSLGPGQPGQPEPGAAVPVLRHLGPGDHQPRRPARRAQRLPVRRGRRPPPRADRDRRGQRGAVGVGAAEFPRRPAAPALLPGRDRRQRAGGGRLRGGGRALAHARLPVGRGHLVLGGVHLGLAQHRQPRPAHSRRARQRREGGRSSHAQPEAPSTAAKRRRADRAAALACLAHCRVATKTPPAPAQPPRRLRCSAAGCGRAAAAARPRRPAARPGMGDGQPDGQLRQHARHGHARLPRQLRHSAAAEAEAAASGGGVNPVPTQVSAWPAGRG